MLLFDFLEYHHRWPRIDQPQTFCEKILHRKLFDRDPGMVALSDKILAKRRVSELLGPEWITPSIWAGHVLTPECERRWPIPYVLKASHGCGWNFFVRTQEEQVWDSINREAAGWLGKTWGLREWIYTQIEPGLLVEPYIGSINEVPADYKLFVFGGRTRFVQVDLGRGMRHEQYFYDLDWNRLPWTFVCEYSKGEVPRPCSLEKMIWGANRLGEAFPFVRVDLYEIDGKPRFGECTFYPTGGRNEFKPRSVELEIGQMWPDS